MCIIIVFISSVAEAQLGGVDVEGAPLRCWEVFD